MRATLKPILFLLFLIPLSTTYASIQAQVNQCITNAKANCGPNTPSEDCIIAELPQVAYLFNPKPIVDQISEAILAGPNTPNNPHDPSRKIYRVNLYRLAPQSNDNLAKDNMAHCKLFYFCVFTWNYVPNAEVDDPRLDVRLTETGHMIGDLVPDCSRDKKVN